MKTPADCVFDVGSSIYLALIKRNENNQYLGIIYNCLFTALTMNHNKRPAPAANKEGIH
jgi:hypothetical protein